MRTRMARAIRVDLLDAGILLPCEHFVKLVEAAEEILLRIKVAEPTVCNGAWTIIHTATTLGQLRHTNGWRQNNGEQLDNTPRL